MVSPLRIEVRGLSPSLIQSTKSESLQVFVASGDQTAALLGESHVENETFVFVPKYPLREGLEYIARFEPSRMETRLRLPEKKRQAPTRVTALYPSADQVPENLLKLYVHLSVPMSRGDSYRHVVILDEMGNAVELPFVEIAEELWDSRQQRLTLLLDPGRIKRGLRPNKEAGPPLIAGHSYTLVISSEWQDAERQPLADEFRRTFRVGPFDAIQPDPGRWELKTPRAGTNDSLTIRFAEPLDNAMLQHCINVLYASEHMKGDVRIEDHEMTWIFTPLTPWARGEYTVEIDTRLEDLAGNSIQRPFEVDETIPRDSVQKFVALTFTIH